MAVASGKGGVGKTTTAGNLATALARQGLRVGHPSLDTDRIATETELRRLEVGHIPRLPFDRPQHDIQHVYLKEAQALRPDKTVVLSSVDMAELNRWIEAQLRQWNVGR